MLHQPAAALCSVNRAINCTWCRGQLVDNAWPMCEIGHGGGVQGSGHLLHQHLGQMGLGALADGQALAQVGAQAAQLGYAGDDVGLLGERWERHWRP